MVWKRVSELKEHPHKELVPPMRPQEYSELKKDIQEHGILQPIEINFDGVILDGHHRYSIAKELGIESVDCRIVKPVVDEDSYLISVALLRRQLTEDQRVVLADEYAESLSKYRQSEAGKKAIEARWHGGKEYDVDTVTTSYKLPDQVKSENGGRTRTVVAKKFKVPERKMRYIRQLKETKPEIIPQILSGEKKILEVMREIEKEKLMQNKGTVPLPDGKFRCIVIDPPWPIEKILLDKSPAQISMDYKTMAVDEIKAIPVGEKAYSEGCHVFLWTTQKYLPVAFDLFKEWGVKYECTLVWVKNGGFTPFSFQYNTEFVLFGRIGNLPVMKMGIKTAFYGERRGHSVKPEEFFDIVKEVSPEPRLEMFARGKHDGFVPWGDQVED